MANKNYNKAYNKSEKTKVDEQPKVDEEPSTKGTKVDESEVTTEPIVGFVANCEQLRIRNAPNTDSEILVIVNKGTKVEIDEELSTDDFYSVTAHCPDDITVIGYAMKDFISIK